MKSKKVTKKVASQKNTKSEEKNTYDFLTCLCASRKIKVAGKIEKATSGTIKVFNAYRRNNEKFDNCKGRHYEVFQELRKKSPIKAFGLTCKLEQGKNITDRYMIFDKMPKGLEVKKSS